jgi:hypothetical protein
MDRFDTMYAVNPNSCDKSFGEAICPFRFKIGLFLFLISSVIYININKCIFPNLILIHFLSNKHALNLLE